MSNQHLFDDATSDPLWREFCALWPTIGALEPPVLLSGGYGLFLKQSHLSKHPELRTVVPIANWLSATPRSTRDMDFLLDVDIIASEEAQGEIRRVLNANCYTAKVPHWQFEKPLPEEQAFEDASSICVDLLTPSVRKVEGVKMDRVRIKKDPSLGEEGVHGHTIREAIGLDLAPYRFERRELSLLVPNPVSWCVMKLIATRDRWQKSQNADVDVEEREKQRGQAIKHAGDVYRVLALTTREENVAARAVLDELRPEAIFQEAAGIAQEYFLQAGAVMTRERTVAGAWQSEDRDTLQEVLRSWFVHSEAGSQIT